MMFDPDAFAAATTRPRGLVGREDEVRAMRAALADLRSGAGRAIALAGEPGIGKSALMSALTAEARAAGIPVLVAHSRDPNPLSLPGAGQDGHDRRHRSDASTAGDAMVAAVDDLHHLTDDQIPGVQRLIRTVAARPTLLLMAYRERQLAPALAVVLARAVDAGLLEVIRPGPLSPGQARLLVGDLPGLDDIHRVSLGNPLYLKASAADGAARAAAGTAILGELAELDHAARTVAGAAAVLGAPVHPDLLAEVAGLGAAETKRALGELTRADIVRSADPSSLLTLRHPVVGEVVRERLDPCQRAEMHRRAAAALAERSAPVAQRAHHVAQAPDRGRPDHVRTLVAAARDLLHTAPAEAAGYLQVAESLLDPGDGQLYEARILLARARLLAGDVFASRAVLNTLRPEPPDQPPQDVAAVVAAGRIEHGLGRYPEAAAIGRSGLAALADHDTAGAAALHTGLADAALDQQQYEAARQHADIAAAIARRHHDRVGEAHALALASLAHLFTGDQATAEATAARAADLVDAGTDAVIVTDLPGLCQLGFTQSVLGHLTDAQRHLTRAAALSRRTGQIFILPKILKSLAETQLRSGSLRRALATLDEAAHYAEHTVSPSTQAIIMMLRANALLWQGDHGDLDEVLALAGRAAEIADGPPTAWAVQVRCHHAEIVLLTGDAARSKWLMLDAVGGVELPRLTTWRRPRWCATLAQVALHEGDPRSAEHWARLAEASVEESPSAGRQGFAGRARMHAHTLRGDVEQAAESARRAVEGFSAGGERIESCRTLLAAVTLSLDAGQTDDVDDLLGRAAFLADQCGSGRLLGDVAVESGRLAAQSARGRAAGAPAVLSAREREIAELARRGMSSREIAGALFLSVRTVDSHLGRMYRKLGVSNRAELTKALLNLGSEQVQ